MARNIWLHCATYDIELIVVHIPGKQNIVADLLSQCEYSKAQQSRLHQWVPNHVWGKVNPNHATIDYNI